MIIEVMRKVEINTVTFKEHLVRKITWFVTDSSVSGRQLKAMGKRTGSEVNDFIS